MNLAEALRRLTFGRAMLIGMGCAALYYFIFFDEGLKQKSQLNQARTKINNLQKKIKEDQDALDRAKVYQQTAAEVGSTINKLVKLIPEKFSMADLMRIVSNESKVAGSSLATIKPGKAEVSKTAGEFEELSVEVELSGSFLQHMVFLSNLTKVQQILIVKKADFTHLRDGRDDESPIVRMNASLTAFRYLGADAEKSKAGGKKK